MTKDPFTGTYYLAKVHVTGTRLKKHIKPRKPRKPVKTIVWVFKSLKFLPNLLLSLSASLAIFRIRVKLQNCQTETNMTQRRVANVM